MGDVASLSCDVILSVVAINCDVMLSVYAVAALVYASAVEVSLSCDVIDVVGPKFL